MGDSGSERASATLNRGDRLKEGCCINQSLLALANCINALHIRQLTSAQQQQPQGGRLSSFVNYRNSKLTHLLKNSLEGHCLVVMIANVHPSASAFAESSNTLKYANRAKNLKVPLQLLRAGQSETETDRPRMLLLLHEQQQQLLRLQAFLKSRDSLIAKQEEELELHRRVVASQQQKLKVLTQQKDELRDKLQAALGGKAFDEREAWKNACPLLPAPSDLADGKQDLQDDSTIPAAQLASLSLVQSNHSSLHNLDDSNTPPRVRYTRNEDSNSRPRDPLVAAAAAASVGSQGSPSSSSKNAHSPLRRSRRLLPAARPCLCEDCLAPSTSNEKQKPEVDQGAASRASQRHSTLDAEGREGGQGSTTQKTTGPLQDRTSLEMHDAPPSKADPSQDRERNSGDLEAASSGLTLDETADEASSRRKRITLDGAEAIKADEKKEALPNAPAQSESDNNRHSASSSHRKTNPHVRPSLAARRGACAVLTKGGVVREIPNQKRRCVRTEEGRNRGSRDSRPPSINSVISASGDESEKRLSVSNSSLLPRLHEDGTTSSFVSSSSAESLKSLERVSLEEGRVDSSVLKGPVATNEDAEVEEGERVSELTQTAGAVERVVLTPDAASASSEPMDSEAALTGGEEGEGFLSTRQETKKTEVQATTCLSSMVSNNTNTSSEGMCSLSGNCRASKANLSKTYSSKKPGATQALHNQSHHHRRLSTEKKISSFHSSAKMGALPPHAHVTNATSRQQHAAVATVGLDKKSGSTLGAGLSGSRLNVRTQQPSSKSSEVQRTRWGHTSALSKEGMGERGASSSSLVGGGLPAEGSCSSLKSAMSGRSANSCVFADTASVSSAAVVLPGAASMDVQSAPTSQKNKHQNAHAARRVRGGSSLVQKLSRP